MLLFNTIFSIAAIVLTVKAVAPACGSYVVNSAGEDLSFSSYLFTDFRTIGNNHASATGTKSVVDKNAAAKGKQLTKRNNAAMASYFTNGLQRIWQVQKWERPSSPVPMSNVAENVFIADDPSSDNTGDTMLSITTQRGQNGVQKSGEVASAFRFKYGSIRFQARVTGDSGACGGMFLYRSDTLESDFEFLTQEGPDYVHLTNQPGQKDGYPVPGAHSNITLKTPYDQWNTYRLDWMPGMTRYYINGELAVEKTVNVSPEAMLWMMNMWSDGTVWPGVMAVGGSAKLDVRWLQIAFNKATESFGSSAGSGVACRLQNEMEGQGLVADSVKAAHGGSIAARAAALVGLGSSN